MTDDGALHGGWAFWNIQRFSNMLRQKTNYLPHHKSWLTIGDNFIGLNDFLPEYLTHTQDVPKRRTSKYIFALTREGTFWNIGQPENIQSSASVSGL